MTNYEKCGQHAGSFIPRWGMSWACVLEKGHDGPHRGGGTCARHGDYVSLDKYTPTCPHWPACNRTEVQEAKKVIELSEGEVIMLIRSVQYRLNGWVQYFYVANLDADAAKEIAESKELLAKLERLG